MRTIQRHQQMEVGVRVRRERQRREIRRRHGQPQLLGQLARQRGLGRLAGVDLRARVCGCVPCVCAVCVAPPRLGVAGDMRASR